ncbi:hypothetical protein [Rhizobium sp. Root1220]|uniref:DUF7338 family protein n=1 Tax=Rhizobium sp. Root1220 TaxID=1736432 RepID=UPI0006F92FF4|nr:hypothetical protein [Rhizobium sp. Root1220]KQV81748.1 hypothetical protein ASC90_05430 [Rhizobium sp. Root1220]
MFWKVFRLAPLSVAIYPACALLSWLATLLSYPLSPLIAGISMVTGKNEVGGLLAYFYTHDNSLDGGVDAGIPGYDANARGLKRWWLRVCWICRNPSYRFNAYVLGLPAGGTTIIFRQGEWPNFRLWTVLETKSGRRYFGYRGKNDQWFGWNYIAYAGRHLLKSKPI